MHETQHRPTERVLNILELLASQPEGLTLTEIALNIDAPKSSILPLLKTMHQRKFITSDTQSAKYYLGIASYVVGSAYASNKNSLQFIQDVMRRIVDKCNETCQLGILNGGEVLYVAKVESDEPIRLASYVGKRMAPHCSAIGKALISDHKKEELEKLFPTGLKSYTDNTITDMDTLVQELAEVQESQIACENSETMAHLCCISVPLKKEGKILAAISVSFPEFRYTDEKNALIREILLEAKKEVESFFKEKNVDIDSLTYA